MNCTLTIAQQKLLFGKVAIDLKNLPKFDLKSYAKDFHDLILDKTGDKVLAANYVALLPMNIRAVMGVNKSVFKKLAGVAGQISDYEARFEDFVNVENFVNEFIIGNSDLANLEKTLQVESLTVAPQQVEVETVPVIEPIESLLLSDVPFDNDKENFLKPEMKVYADAKAELIKNKKVDGSSELGGIPVRLNVISTVDFKTSDFYPDTQRALNSNNPNAVLGAKSGVVLAVTRMDGTPIRFNDKLEQTAGDDPVGKVIYYTIRKPVEGQALNQADKDLVARIQKEQKIGQAEAEAAVIKKLALIRKVRDYVSKDPKNNSVGVNLVGGTVQYAAKPSTTKNTISKLNFKEGQFTPYKGTGTNGLKANVYYFDYSDTVRMSIDSPAIPQELIQKLTQLLTEDVDIRAGKQSFSFTNFEKIRLFKQFIYVDADVFDLTTDELGNLVVKKLGVTQSYPTKEALAQDIQAVLTRKVPIKKITAEQAKGKTRTVDLRGAMFNQVWEQKLPDGGVNYYTIGQVQLKVNDTAFKNNLFNDFTLNPREGGFAIDIRSKPYYPFIADNFLIGYEVDASGNLQQAGSVLNFEVQPNSLIKLQNKNKPEAATIKEDDKKVSSTINDVPIETRLSAKDKLLRLRKEDLDKFNKLTMQKGVEATLEQIDAAEKWYNTHPMSAYFPFETLFDVVNQETSNSIATWTTSGITLFKGADYSDLYHEAWHGFTQGFLSKEEKTKLYNDTRKRSGTFVDYQGNLVEFKNATELQAEEFLAEDFRTYMLSDGKKVMGSSVQNSIFRKILNFLKSLFGNASLNQAVSDVQSTAAITELYNKLRVGDLSSYTFAAENRNYDTLNKALQSVNKDEAEKSLSFENSNLIYNTIDSLFSEGIDVMNQANLDDIEERRTLQAKPNLSDAEKEKLKELNAQITSGYTTLLLSTPKGVRSLYEYAKARLEEQLEKIKDDNAVGWGKPTSTYIQKKIDLLSYALRNYGDVAKLYNNSKDTGVIGYHMFKSGLIEDDLFDELSAIQRNEELQKDIDELSGREASGKDFFDRGGNEISIFDLAVREIKNIVGSLNKTDINGTVIDNQLGFPELVNYREAFAYIARIIQNSKDLPTMYNTLQKESDVYHPIKQLLAKLGPLEYEGQTDREVDLWSKFFQTFNKYRIVLVQTTVNEEERFKEIKNQAGETVKVKIPSVYDIRIGNALSDYKRVDQDWRADFAKVNTNPLIKNDIKGNYLAVNDLFNKYPTMDAVNAEPLQFLNDIGIKMKEINVIKTEVEKAIKSGYIRLNGIYNNLAKLNQQGQIVRGIGTYLQNNPKMGLVGQTGPNSNYGKLLVIQSKYSGDYSDFMVQNAAGDPQSEFSQNNTLTQYAKQFNSTKDYNGLVADAATAHYNNAKNIPGRPYNPFVNASIWMNSLYNMNENGGPRYADNEMVIENLSGINSSINDGFFQDGVATSQADEVGKLLNDFHIQLMKFTPELTRHAGKKTSLAVSLRNYKTGSKNSKLYIDTENFVTPAGEYNKGVGEFYKILTKYIGAELDRVNYAKYLLTPEAGVQEFDFAYLNRATKFVAFAGVLNEDTKALLYNVKGDLSEYLNKPEGTALADKMYDDIQNYFYKLVDGVQNKMNKYNFISPSLIEKTKSDAEKIGKVNIANDVLTRGLTSSFVANNWIHHFEEMIVLYGDIALYKDFFKRNAALNSTGDIIRNDEYFIRYVNNVLGKPFSKQAGATDLSYNGQLNTAVVADVLTKSVYLDEYRKTVNSPVIDAKYGDKGINEADAQGLITFDTYRIILKGLSKWTTEQEDVYQQLLSGTPAADIDTKQFFPTLKMGYYGPVQNEYLPLTGLHKFALFPLIPGVIPTNLQVLHEKMMKEGIDYLTFESGSKVGTISKKEGIQPLYSDVNKRELSTAPFVKNKIFSEYLKYQVEAAPKWKSKMTLPTQLRGLALLGLENNGVPIDYSGTKQSWEALNETQKKLESKNYKLRQNYIQSLDKLVDAKKNQLLGDIGWKRDKDGNLKGDMSSLLELISNELKRSDVGDHEWAYIQTIKGNDIKNSLDISQSADMIEKVITSLVNKRLINIKVNGEQLVMVSTTGFEDKAFAYSKERSFDKPTDEDLQKYGTNDLPTYHIRDGKIAAAKVKIAIQGDFKKLLELSDVNAKAKQLGVSRLTALNILLKDDTWLDQENNRAMISMVGARIPTQGPNSADFVEVYEFLPEIAGNIVIAPSEVTSKGGSDFDYDKLPLMMPNIRIVNGRVELAKNYNEDQARLAYKELLKANIHKMTFQGLDKNEIRILLRTSDRFEKVDKIVADLLGNDYYEELGKIVQEETMESFEDFFEELNGTKAIENELQDSLRNILELPSNFADLIRPNETDLIKPYADEIRGDVSKLKEGTRMFEVLHNLDVQQANSVGKDTLGIGAINNKFNAVFDSVGVETLPEYELYEGDNRRATLLFKHNATKDGGISLSNRFDKLNENNIADVLSQLINGWVDVEKDDWISYIQGNKEVAPVLLFMVRAGVPIKDVIKFVTQPIIRQYAEEKRLAKNSFSKVLLGSDQSKRYKRYAQSKILSRFGMVNPKSRDIYHMALAFTEGIDDFASLEKGLSLRESGTATPVEETKIETFADAQMLEGEIKKKIIEPPQFERSITNLFVNSGSEKEAKFLHRKFTLLTHPDKGGKVEFSQILNDVYDKYKEGSLTGTGEILGKKKKAASKAVDINLATFLHFLEIENMASQMDKLQRAFNVDTTTLQSLTEFYGKIQEIEDLKGFVPAKVVEEIKNNSPIGPFYIQKFALDLFGRVLPLRNSGVVNEFLNSLDSDDIHSIYDLTNEDDRIRFYQTFKNDLFSYIFQNQLRGFNPAGQNYRNNKVTFPTQKVDGLRFGAFVKDGTLYVDKSQLSKDYDTQAYSKEGYGNGQLALVPENAFVNQDEYEHFVYERETLRSLYPFKALNGSIEFNELVKENERKDELRKEGETQEEFIPRIERLSYEQLLRDKALYNTFNAWQLFRSSTNVANTYGFILDKYPQLKQYFSILNNIKKSSKDGLTNLMPSTLKFTKDEIDTFHENFQDLANSNKLLKIEGINQRDADYISSFFTKLPLYLYMQSGPNTRNAFSFGRIIPQEKIQRILEKPVKDLTAGIDEAYLKEFLTRFVTANADKTTRQRFKEFLKPDVKSKVEPAAEAVEDTLEEEIPKIKPEEPKQISDEEVTELMNRCFI